MKTVKLFAAFGSLLAAASAGAVTFTPTNGGTAVFTSSAAGAQYTFETAATGNIGNPAGFVRTGGLVMSGNTFGVGANPFGAPAANFYLYVTAGSRSTIVATSPGMMGYQAISFYIGSIDAGNSVSILGAGGAILATYTGTQLAAPVSASGAQTLPETNRLLTFTASAGEVLTGITFTSSVNSLEADNVRFTTAVPEPATWAMMMLGFGMVGAVARYRRRGIHIRYA